MALINFRWFSRVLEKQVETQVLLPEHHPERCATFYLLHGLSDDSTMWLRRTRIETDISGLPLIVVMPDGFRGFYTDNHVGPAYGRYIGEELIDVIDRVFPTIATRDKRCIGGLSMGGYGALRTALTYPDRFVSANSHSGALNAGRQNEPQPQTPIGQLFGRIFGPDPHGGPHDLVALAKQAQTAGKLPQLLIDCGEDDFLYDDNVDVTNELRQAAVPHTFRRFPGAHDWDYWAEHVREAVDFHTSAMNVRRPTAR
ncbi:MAG TPA: alpha/beta hydrolase family protein [Tepidisphaeraceae bacterium]